MADHLPQEAEILLEVAGGDVSFLQAVQQSQSAREEASDADDSGFAHPDAQRRFRRCRTAMPLQLPLITLGKMDSVFAPCSANFCLSFL